MEKYQIGCSLFKCRYRKGMPCCTYCERKDKCLDTCLNSPLKCGKFRERSEVIMWDCRISKSWPVGTPEELMELQMITFPGDNGLLPLAHTWRASRQHSRNGASRMDGTFFAVLGRGERGGKKSGKTNAAVVRTTEDGLELLARLPIAKVLEWGEGREEKTVPGAEYVARREP